MGMSHQRSSDQPGIFSAFCHSHRFFHVQEQLSLDNTLLCYCQRFFEMFDVVRCKHYVACKFLAKPRFPIHLDSCGSIFAYSINNIFQLKIKEGIWTWIAVLPPFCRADSIQHSIQLDKTYYSFELLKTLDNSMFTGYPRA